MKRLVHIVEAFGGGVFTFLSELCNRLCGEFDITVAYSKRAETPGEPKSYFDPRVRLLEMRHGKRNIDPLVDSRYIFEIRNLLKKLEPDIVHLHSSKAGFAGRLAACGLGIGGVFYTPHGYSFIKGGGENIRESIYYTLERLAGMTGATTIAVGRGEYGLAGRLCKRAEWVNNGVDLSYVRKFSGSRPIPSRPLVAAMGRIELAKNPHLFNRIAKMLPLLSFMWIGGGAEEDALSSENITVTGWKEREEALTLLSEADFFIMPSRREGLPLALLEAMGMGKICVAANIPGIREIIRHGENGFLASSAEEYADIITGLAEKLYDIPKISANAVETVRNGYSADKMSLTYAAMYKGVSIQAL